MSKSSPSPRSSEQDSSSVSSSGIRPKTLGLHESSIGVSRIASRASALQSEPPDSCHKIATVLLRKTRDELDITQDEAASLVEVHPVSFGRRERGQVDLGVLRDWAVMVREIVRTKGPEAAGVFMAQFIEALVERDTK